MGEITNGEGYAFGTLDDLGEGYGFRKIRKALGVTAFGINALVIPPGYSSGEHYHEQQEETYFVHRGTAEFAFGDGSRHRVGAGGVVRVDPATIRGYTNVGDEDLVIVVVGGKDGYVGRDGRTADGRTGDGPPGMPGA